MDTPEVRRRLRAVIEQAKSGAAARRERGDTAAREYEAFLRDRAVPTFHTFAAALVAEGLRFKVFTPAGSVRLASEGGGEDFIEIALDPALEPPRPVGHTSRGRGRRLVVTERAIRAGAATADLTEEDVLEFLVEEIAPFVER
ncbi:MAG: hypothetical protein ABIX28_02700 [Vicinamibacterales bacterium]